MHRTLICLSLLPAAACTGDDGPTTSPEPTVMTAMVAQGAWSEDLVWGADNWVPCTGCEHVISYDLDDDAFTVHVFERTPGEPASRTERCTAIEHTEETTIDGFDPRDRTILHFDILAEETDCGWGDSSGDYVFEVVERGDDGRPTYVANWLLDDPAAAFPGYDFERLGALAVPLKTCPGAPEDICEPACDPAAGPCDLPES